MPPTPSTAALFPFSRSAMLAASSAACGLLLLLLLVALVGCADIVGADFDPKTLAPSDSNANASNVILCSCSCPIDAAPGKSTRMIMSEADDAVQGSTQTAPVLYGSALELGAGNRVALRFQNVGIPPGAAITAAYIQFTAAQGSTGAAELQVGVVDSPNAAEFTVSTDLQTLTLITSGPPWQPGEWKVNEATANEQAQDLQDLLKAIVIKDGYTPQSSVAFIISGTGQRVAKSFPDAGAPVLIVEHVPKTTQQDFLACGDRAYAKETCQTVQINVTDLATACGVATPCGCTVKEGTDTSGFASVCSPPCPPMVPYCDSGVIIKTDAATASHTPVCLPWGL